jgi:hypothetical protein
VSGSFTFRYPGKVRTVPVGYCSPISSFPGGTLTITEDLRAGYAVSDIYTIPADRLISKDLNTRSVTVTIVPGSTALQTIIVFVNRSTRSEVITNVAASNQSTDLWSGEKLFESFFLYLKESFSRSAAPVRTTAYIQ